MSAVRGPDPYPPIGDYALIGDGRSAALVSRDGSLDWLCWPRFDSPSLFAALLDTARGGRFRVRPTGTFRSERRYLPDTNVLETVFHTPSGAVALRDLMPVVSEEDKRAALIPEHEVLREVEGLVGQVEVEVVYTPRPDYGRKHPDHTSRGAFGLWCEGTGSAVVLQSDLPLQLNSDGHSAKGAATIASGERKHLSLVYSTDAPGVIPLLEDAARDRIERSVRWWRDMDERYAIRDSNPKPSD